MTDVSILHEIIVGYGVLICPFLCSQFFLEEVRIEDYSCTEKVGKVLRLTRFSPDEVLGEKSIFLFDH